MNHQNERKKKISIPFSIELLCADPPRGQGCHSRRLFDPMCKYKNHRKILDTLIEKIPRLREREMRGCVLTFELRTDTNPNRGFGKHTPHPEYVDVWVCLFSPIKSEDIIPTEVNKQTWLQRYIISLVGEKEWMIEEFYIREDDLF
jgi:hypothetical protein